MQSELPARATAGPSRKWLWLAGALAPALFCAATEAADVTKVKAPFIAGTWATEDGCKKLAAIAAGAPRSVETVPETLSADGYASWEGGCSFTDIKETVTGRKWMVKTECVDGAEEWSDEETMEFDETGKRLTVTVESKATVFVRCEAEKGN